jgi:hypothetical protein
MNRQHQSFRGWGKASTLTATGYSGLKKKNTIYTILKVHVKILYRGTGGEIKPDPE